MRLRLASLALLLLALCRSSSAGSVVAFHSIDEKGAMGAMDASVNGAIATKPAELSNGNPDELADLMSNTLILIGSLPDKKYEQYPQFLKEALINGVHCEADPKHIPALTKASHGVATMGKPQRDEEDKAIGKLFDLPEDLQLKKIACPADAPGIAAIPEPGERCYCETDLKPLMHCFLLGLSAELTKRGFAKKPPCREDAMKALKAAGKQALGAMYDAEDFAKADFTAQLNGDIDKLEAAVLCDALDANVATAVKNLYAADALYWLVEHALFTAVLGEPTQSLEKACADDDEFKSSAYGKCICTDHPNTGFSFCIYKVVADAATTAGYLNCADASGPKVDPAKKAAVVVPKAPKAKPQKADGGAPGAPPAAGNTTEAPASDGASDLPLLPLATAAALLLGL